MYDSYHVSWARAWQNQQNDMGAQQRLKSTWVSAKTEQSLLSAQRWFESLATHEVHSKDWSDWTHVHVIFVGFVMLWLICTFIVNLQVKLTVI